jgi:hypothetical protein
LRSEGGAGGRKLGARRAAHESEIAGISHQILPSGLALAPCRLAGCRTVIEPGLYGHSGWQTQYKRPGLLVKTKRAPRRFERARAP